MTELREAPGPSAESLHPRSAIEQLSGRALGEFVVREVLGQGAMGAVYRAEQPLLGRDAVIKVMLPGGQNGDLAIRRFLREARLASKLDHPYAAHIYAFGAESDGLLWIAMELVRGTPLSEYLKEQENGRLPIARVIPLMERICEVVQAAHDAGIVHRDLKPANVMVLTRAGRLFPKLLDFGIAKMTSVEDEPATGAVSPSFEDSSPNLQERIEATAVSERARLASMTMEITSQETQLGSPAFMAPEQWFNAATVDGRADVYSLGVMLYQLLSGKLPFAASSLAKLMSQHAKAPVPPLPPELELPVAVDLALKQAMAKKPSDRFQSALDLAQALRQAAQLQDDLAAVPQLDEEVRETCLANAPQPLAEAVALIESARTSRAAQEALRAAIKTLVRYLSVVALAARVKTGAGEGDSPRALELMGRMRKGPLPESDWLALVLELAGAFRSQRASYPLPELLDVLAPDIKPEDAPLPIAVAVELEALTRLREGVSADAVLPHLELSGAMARLGQVLRRLSFLFDYPLVRTGGGVPERMMGLRRQRGARQPGRDDLEDDELVLLDDAGTTVLVLSPFAQPMSPTPGAPEEVFLFEGEGRYGAKLAAHPLGFERHDESLGTWLTELLPGLGAETPGQLAAEKTPFQGLASFTSDDADHYYGREREAEAFANRLRMQSMLAVVGPSGVGKSSFIQAGVLPRLAGVWRSLTVRPGPAPLAALAATLEEAGLGAPNLKAELSVRPAVLGERLRLGAQNGPGLLLIVDQFEELITLCADPQERKQYAEALVAAARSVHEPVRVVLTLRDDFLIRVQQISALRERLAPGLQLLATPALEDLQRILAEPIRRLGYSYDDDALPRLMAEQVAQQPGALALLSFTATKLWELRDRRLKRLTRKAYEALGGVGGALAHHAEETLSALSEPEQKLVRETFRHLVSAEGTRAILTRSELRELLGPQGLTVVEKLIHARLLTASESATGEDRVEVIHEALLISWPRLVKWQREDAENARLRDQLRAAARQWEERKRSKGVLWRGEALMEYRLWRGRYPGAVTASEDAFARASLAEDQRGRQLRQGILIGAFTLLGVVLVVVFMAQLRAQKSSREAHESLARLHVEQGRLSALDGKPLQALVYLAQAYAEGVSSPSLRYLLGRVRQSVSFQRGVLVGHQGKLFDAQFSPDGTEVATADDDHTAGLWDARTSEWRFVLTHPRAVTALAFNPVGDRLVTGCEDGVARVFNTRDGKVTLELRQHPGGVNAVAFSVDGKRIATAGADRQARLWDAGTGQLLATLQGSPEEISLLRFSPGGHWLLTAPGLFGGDGMKLASAILWDARTGERGATLLGHTAPVLSADFSPDGRRVVTTGVDHTARVYETDTGRTLLQVPAGEHTVRAVAFSPDGKTIATAGDDKIVQLWDSQTGARGKSLAAHTSAIRSIAFSPDGTRLVSGGRDSAAYLWDVAEGRPLQAFLGHLDTIAFVHFSKDGQQVVTSSRDFTARLWDATSRRQTFSATLAGKLSLAQLRRDGHLWVTSDRPLRVVDPNGGPLETIPLPGANMSLLAVNADFTRAATPGLGDSHDAEVWDLQQHKRMLRLEGHTDVVDLAVFSPDGREVYTGGEDQRVICFDAQTGARRWELRLQDFPQALEVSPDGKLLVVGQRSQPGVLLYSTADGHLQARLVGHTLGVFAIAFSPDSSLLATGGGDTTVRLWSVKDAKALRTMYGHQGNLNTLAFRGDGALVASTSMDGTVRVWGVDEGVLLETMELGAGILSAGFTADGSGLFSAVESGKIDLWNARPDDSAVRDVQAFAACRAPFQLQGEYVIAVPAHACATAAAPR